MHGYYLDLHAWFNDQRHPCGSRFYGWVSSLNGPSLSDSCKLICIAPHFIHNEAQNHDSYWVIDTTSFVLTHHNQMFDRLVVASSSPSDRAMFAMVGQHRMGNRTFAPCCYKSSHLLKIERSSGKMQEDQLRAENGRGWMSIAYYANISQIPMYIHTRRENLVALCGSL